MADKSESTGTVTVTLSTNKGNFSGSSSTTLIISMKDNPDKDPALSPPNGNAKATLTVPADVATQQDAGENPIKVTAMADKYVTGTKTIPIIVRRASDVRGFRVVVTSHNDGAWVKVGNKIVKVQVRRVKGIAYPWTDLESIRVSLLDTTYTTQAVADEMIEAAAGDPNAQPPVPATSDTDLSAQLSAKGFSLIVADDGTKTAERIELGVPLTALGFVEASGNVTFQTSRVSGGGSNSQIVYLPSNSARAYEALEFRLQVPTNRGSATNGQYFGVYAVAEITGRAAKPDILESRNTKDPIYEDPGVLGNVVPNAAERVVGDGKLLKLDNMKPTVGAVSNIAVTIDEDGNATVGDKIRAAVQVGTPGTLFRDSRVQIRLQTATLNAADDALGVKRKGQTAKPVNFTGPEVIAKAADSLRVTWEVTEGLFKLKPDDFVAGIGPKDTPYEPDNWEARVQVLVFDQAGNNAVKNSTWFPADSKSPSVSILYPSADPDSAFAHPPNTHFTGAIISTVQNQNVDDHLNPLRIAVNEKLQKIEVFAVGADTLTIPPEDQSIFASASGAVMDSIRLNTEELNSPKKDKAKNVFGEDNLPEDVGADDLVFVPSSKNVGGTEIDLVVLVTDLLGNTTKATSYSSVTHDAAQPKITEWFPKNRLIENDQINDATRHPVFTLKESVDSIAVNFTASNGAVVKEEVAEGAEKGETQVVVSGALAQDESYSMTIFLRDLAGNVFITPADSSANMTFNAQFDNPKANRFKVTTETDSVIAGQANKLMIQAEDHDAGSNTTRNALTYKNVDEDGNMAAEVRISAWDASGGVAESVSFEGKGVTDDAVDGMATLDAGGWTLGKRTVIAKSNMALEHVKILVEHRNAGDDGTTMAEFNGAIDSLYVGAADFNKFKITAEKDGEVVESVDVGDKFTLRVVPTDRHGNPSVRAFKADPAGDDADSLDVLDTRAKDNAYDYKDGFDVTVRSSPELKGLPAFEWTLDPEGWPFSVAAPDEAGNVSIQVRIDNATINSADTRSQNTRTGASVSVVMPLTPELTLWPEGVEVDGKVMIPADPGTITVTVRAEGFNPGSMVTFTKDGTAMDPVTADDDGYATLDITMAEAGTVTVSATDGDYSTGDREIVFDDRPVRQEFVDANGDPVYLITSENMTVDIDDFLAFVAAYGSSEGDDNYNVQANLDGDTDVDIDDYLEFLKSYGRTAVGPATKPLVLAPGINENAEFSLSLGSERVVAGELVAVDVSLANVAALVGYGFALNYESDKFEFVSVAPADEDLLKSTGGETLFHHVVADGQVTVANGLYNGTAVSGGGDVVRFVFRVLREFEDNARFEVADGLVFDPGQLSNPAVVAGVLELQSTPREFALHQNFPNPFNPDTTIKYDLAESADVTLQIYNVLGQVVRTLVASEVQNAGRYQIRWNGMDDRGVPVSSGIYFYQIAADGKFSDVRKLMLLK